MSELTITEALAEIKTVGKRLNAKRQAVMQYVTRQDGVRDPLEKQGGSVAYIEQERQSIKDLEDRVLSLRRAIQKANEETAITVGGETRSISDWLVWRRDVAPHEVGFLRSLMTAVNNARINAQRSGVAIVQANAGTDNKPTDIVVNVDERGLNARLEAMEEILGNLDGQLSLKNATVVISAS